MLQEEQIIKLTFGYLRKNNCPLHIWRIRLKVLSSEMDLAEIHPSPILWKPFKDSALSKTVIGH